MWLGRLRCAKLYKRVDMTGSDIRIRNCKFWNITVGLINVRTTLISNATFSFTTEFVTYRRPVGIRPFSLPQMLILHSADVISVRCLYIYLSYAWTSDGAGSIMCPTVGIAFHISCINDINSSLRGRSSGERFTWIFVRSLRAMSILLWSGYRQKFHFYQPGNR